MVQTRSNSGQESAAGTTRTTEDSTSGASRTTDTSSGELGTTTTTTTTTDASTAEATRVTVQANGARAPADTSGIRSTPAASIVTIAELPERELMPPPTTATCAPTPTPARSRRSKASSKRLLAGLEAKERLAELELKRISAEMELERIRQDRLQVETESSDSEQDDLAPQRVADWFERRPVQTAMETQEDHRTAARANRAHARRGTGRTQMDVSSLAAALTEAIQTGKSTRRFIPDLPQFSGLSQEWLQFKAAYMESAESFTASENVARIRRSLKGVAWEAVSALLISHPRPEDVISSLERRFGRPDALIMGETEKMKTLPRLTDNPRDLCVFASRIANTVATIELLNRPQYLYNPELTRLVVDKLTPIVKNKWYDYADMNEGVPELKKIAEFLNREADKCAAYAAPEQEKEHREPRVKKKLERTYATAPGEYQVRKHAKDSDNQCPQCKCSDHQLPTCPLFIKAAPYERWETAKKHNMCYRCLTSTHRRVTCRAKPCGLDGCPIRHHRLLHIDRKPAAVVSPDPPPIDREQVVATAVEQVAGTAAQASRGFLKVTPVLLRGPKATVETYALLDEGSTITIIDAALADTLGLDGPTEPMWVQGVSGSEVHHRKSKRVSVAIRGKHSHDELKLHGVRTVQSLDFATQTVSDRELRGCTHLQDVKSELMYANATPKILIGQDNWEVIVSRDIKQGQRDQLVASKTLLGWVLHGCRSSQAAPVAFCCAHLTKAQSADIQEQMRRYFTLESLNIEPRRQSSDPELQALKILDTKSRRLPDGRFETALLWKQDNGEIPNNRPDALRRLYTLEKKLDRQENLYTERIENMIKSNYAERATAPPSEKSNYVHKQAGFQLRGWATNQRAATSDVTERPGPGEATVAIGGSELEKTLGLLWDTNEDCIRFRFNRRKAPPEILDGLRAPTKREALSVIMSVFDPLGLISPVTTPAKRILQDAWRYSTGWDEPIPDELYGRWQTWLQQLRELDQLSIPRCYIGGRATRYEVHIFVDASEEAYAAAVYWRATQADGSIKVALAAAKSRVTPTKPISVPRLELQAAVLGVRLANAVIEEHDYEVARRVYWSDSRTALTWIRAEPRTYKTFVAHRLAEIEDSTKKQEWRWLPSADNVADDATRATPADFNAQHRWYSGPSFLYTAESRWPTENKIQVTTTGEEKETCKVLKETCKVLTDNEIQVATTSVEKETCNVLVENRETQEHAHLPKIERFSRWTRLVRATARVIQFTDLCRKQTRAYVEQDPTGNEPETCRPSALTTAPPGSQVTIAAARRKQTRAYVEQDPTGNEPETCRPSALTTAPPESQVTIAAARRKRTRANAERDPNWNEPGTRTRRPGVLTTAPSGSKDEIILLEPQYIVAAERLWIRALQMEYFKKEIKRVKENSLPDKHDRLAKLSVCCHEDGILRIKGRIEAAHNMMEETVRPAVLHGKHPYTRLYIAHVHETLHHGGTEITVNELRQRVFIMKIRPAVKEVISRCALCRLKKAKPAAPATGDLPAARLAHHARPFTFTGLDYFGPLEVTVGRHKEKRYVALFTCLTSRAVHLEVAASLSTDSAISALRRFIARRGCPTELWSDNATAFRGADRELAEALRGAAAARRINWRFLPPAAPFMAGAWERMVRTVKEALKVTLHKKHPSDETLHTLLAEVEATVNSRPLTHVAVGPEDPPALTPNMLLVGPNSHVPIPGAFTEKDDHARQHWRRAQHLADTFWRRWVREYLPLLQHRREPLSTGVSPAVGDVVVICDSNLPRNTWPRGRVTQTYPGKDGVVRVVDVTTSRGHILRRPTKKIVVLPVGSQGDGGRMFTTEPIL